jgi:hypothetical protein
MLRNGTANNGRHEADAEESPCPFDRFVVSNLAAFDEPFNEAEHAAIVSQTPPALQAFLMVVNTRN